MYRFTTAIGLICLLVVVGAVASAGTKEDLQEKFKERLPTLQKYKDSVKIGETNLGWVEAIYEEYLEDKDLKKTVDEENADRKELYEIVAKEQSTEKEKVTAVQVGKQNAILKFKKASPAEFFKAKDGKWRQKIQILREKKEKEEDRK